MTTYTTIDCNVDYDTRCILLNMFKRNIVMSDSEYGFFVGYYTLNEDVLCGMVKAGVYTILLEKKNTFLNIFRKDAVYRITATMVSPDYQHCCGYFCFENKLSEINEMAKNKKYDKILDNLPLKTTPIETVKIYTE